MKDQGHPDDVGPAFDCPCLGDEALLSQSKRCFGQVKIASAATVRGPLRLCGLTIGRLEVENVGEVHLERGFCAVVAFGMLLVSVRRRFKLE